jgi:hypothetical protein
MTLPATWIDPTIQLSDAPHLDASIDGSSASS